MRRRLWCRYLALLAFLLLVTTYLVTVTSQQKGRDSLTGNGDVNLGPFFASNSSNAGFSLDSKKSGLTNEAIKTPKQSGENLASPSFQSPFICPKPDTNAGKLNGMDQSLANDCADRRIIRESKRQPGGATRKTIAVVTLCEGCSAHHIYTKSMPRLHRCPHRCLFTTSLEQADAVLFYAFKLKTAANIPTFRRGPGQRWVMISPEAPIREGNHSILDSPVLRGQFNWTVTYRLDSDIVRPYGKLQRQSPPEKDYDSIYHSKRVVAAWFVSNCHTQSKRRHYVRNMLEIADIHIFGHCGGRTCSKGVTKREADTDICFPMLSKSYFFYLAFENSLCDDYVTEKFFKLFGDVDIVPVVRGGADYKRYFPENSFVDASDFDSAQKLAKYLVDLSRDKDRYLMMLKAKNMYSRAHAELWYCTLCEKLHTITAQKWYPDLRGWFVNGSCHEPTDL